MKPEAVLKALVDHRIDLAPVLDATGIVLWTAAVVKLAPDGWQNFISSRDFAQGDSPEEAVGALITKLARQHMVELPPPAPIKEPKKRSKAAPAETKEVPAKGTPSKRRRRVPSASPG